MHISLLHLHICLSAIQSYENSEYLCVSVCVSRVTNYKPNSTISYALIYLLIITDFARIDHK